MERVRLVGRRKAVRAAAPAALLAAATIAVLLVRATLHRSGSEGSTRTVPAVPQPAVTTSRRPRARAEQGRFYRIRSGDTLESVSRRYRTTVDRLLALNPGVEPTGLRVGQRIRVG